ncbi:GGDEF domain-containing protein [Psychrosphaera haliotis]|uniref:GGDEF domain-containing protein n=1 Tax=Psychrosphaera haliotis TaxID=555083 RepID=UPI00236C929E|nr:GGDEF domain-containing protein [Psychrosphaera haliotis]
MKYQDTMEQADQKLQKALGFLKQFRLPASPVNYSVVYEYVSNSNAELCTELDADIKAGRTIDSFLIESLYNRHILIADTSQGALVKDINAVVNATNRHASKAQKDTSNYITMLDEGLLLLDKSDIQTSQQVIERLLNVTSSMKSAQKVLVNALKQAQKRTEQLQQRIDEVEESRKLDQLTGLFDRNVMNTTVDMWLQSDINKIAAIAINLDHFKQFNDNYGVTVGNVILSKVAQKVKSYVSGSGLPIRTGGEEFLILIPETSKQAAKEVAEKVRLGVEKLQFINAKSKEKLPKITVSLGVTEYTETLGLEGTIQRANSALRMAKATGRNRVFVD